MAHAVKRFRRLLARTVMLLLLFAPAFSGAAQALRVAVISDLNGAYGSLEYPAAVDRAVARIVALKPDLVISTGDMVAGQRRPHLARGEVERMWAAFHARVSDPLAAAGIPLAVTPGNHDGSAYHGFEQERAIYRAQWTPRDRHIRFVDRSDYPFRYAFAAGNILFISLDATTVGRLPQGQMDWLRATLARHGAAYRWRVVFSHVPLWPLAQGREREFIGDAGLQALLESARVDLYLSGHHHAFYPGTKGGIAFVGQACLGSGARHLIGATQASTQGFTLLEFGANAIQVAAYAAPKFETEIDWATLPDHVRSAAATLRRTDLAQGAVTRRRAR